MGSDEARSSDAEVLGGYVALCIQRSRGVARANDSGHDGKALGRDHGCEAGGGPLGDY